MNFHFLALIRLQHGTVAGQVYVLTILRKGPVPAGLLQASPHHGFAVRAGTDRGIRIGVAGSLAVLIAGRCWLLLTGATGLTLSLGALRVLVCRSRTARTASTGLC